MTPRSFDSFWVQNELDRARENGIPIFPLLLEGKQWLAVQVLQYVDVRDKSLPPEKFYKRLANVTPRKKTKDDLDELKKLESQAIQFELLGKFSDALRIYYKIKRIDPLFPGIDNKIRQLEYETRLKPSPSVKPSVKSKPAMQAIYIMLGILIFVVGFIGWLGIIASPTRLSHISSPTPFQTLVSSTLLPIQTPIPTTTPWSTQTPILLGTPTLGIGSTMISDNDGMTLLYVPASNFTMGIDNGNPDEKPVHIVYLDSFWIDRTDITNKMYALCVNAGVCKTPTTSSNTHSSYYGNSQYDNYPVISVSWHDATAYCKWADRRLPTEAEWEKAARGTDGKIYPWGNSAPDNTLLNYNLNVGDTTAVGSYPKGASPYGALDMAGNVWQWVNDWYGDIYYQNSPASNPLGPDSGQFRVFRGGSWLNAKYNIYSVVREWAYPASSSPSMGFRCAMSAAK